jgi:CDP-paratose 2-epimerase
MSIALITGSCGLIGSESVKFFLKKGFDVIGIDNNTRKKLFGLDGDISLVQKQLNRDKHYYHKSINIINYSSLETIFKNYGKQIQIFIQMQ